MFLLLIASYSYISVFMQTIDSSTGRDSPRKKKKKGVNPVKALTPSCTRRRLSPGSFATTRSSNFVNVASLRLNLSQLSKKNFSLERVRTTEPGAIRSYKLFLPTWMNFNVSFQQL